MLQATHLIGFAAKRAAASGGGIVTAGLQCHLDAGNSSSYSGSGSTFSDLTGNGYHFTTAGVTFNGSAGGLSSSEYFSFDGSGDNIVLTNTHSGTIMRQMGKTTVDFSLEMWLMPQSGSDDTWWTSTFSTDGLTVRHSNSNYGSNANKTAVDMTGGSGGFVCTNAFTNAAWAQFAVTGRFNGSQIVTQYRNGAANGTGTISGFTATDSVEKPRMGDRSDGLVALTSGSRIAIVRVYNAILTGTEIQQNFDAQKARFGL